jgi:O-antigen/teichoic acid export membrane protein
LFFLDAIYSLGSLGLIAFLVPTGRVTTAAGVMMINLATLTCSSAYGLALIFGKYAIRPGLTGGAVRKVWAYGKYSLGASVSYTLYVQSDNLIISAVMGPVSLAVYNAAKVFTRVYDLILQLINTLLVPVVSKAHSRNAVAEMKSIAEKSLFFFTVATAGVSALFLLLGPTMMRLIYGEKYLEGIPVLYILAVAGIFIPGIAVGASFCHGTANVKPVFQLNLATALVGITLVGTLTGVYGLTGAASAVLATFALIFPAWIFVLVRRLGVPLTPAGVFGRHADISAFLLGALAGREGARPSPGRDDGPHV